MENHKVESKKSLDQLLGQALAERDREEEQVEVTYFQVDEISDSLNSEQQHRLKPKTPSRTPSLKEDADDDNTEPLGSIDVEKKVTRNTITLSIAIALCVNGFSTLQCLQSSIFPQTGVHALCTLYSFAVLSCFFSPYILQKCGHVWTTVTFSIMQIVYLSSFYFYNSYSFILSAILLGATFGPLYCANMTYLSSNISRLSFVTHGIKNSVQQKYLRLFCTIISSNIFWGNLVTSLVMHFDSESIPFFDTSGNVTTVMGQSESEASYDFCFQIGQKQLINVKEIAVEGSQGFSRKDVIIHFNVLHKSAIKVLAVIFVSLVLLGAFVIVVLLEKMDFLLHQDPLERPLVLQSIRQIRLVVVDKHVRLAVPLLIFVGIGQGFMYSDFTRSFVSCSLGLESIVFTMMCLGGSNTLGIIAVNLFSEHIQRTIIMAGGLVCQSGLLMVLYLWTPVKDDAAVFYVIAGGWGLCTAVWETLTITHLASIFVDNWQVPFVTYYLLQWLGMAFAFSVSSFLYSETKVCLLAAALVIAIVPYTILEFKIHQKNALQNRTTML